MPDLQALQRQLQQGMQLFGELQPAMQLLLTGNTPSTSNTAEPVLAAVVTSSSGLSRPSDAAAGASGSQQQQQHHVHPKGIRDTALLAQDLMAVAAEECSLLQQLSQQVAELSDLHTYANSMHVQLLHLRQPALQNAF